MVVHEMGVNVAKGKDSSGHNLRGIQRAPMKILLTVSNEYYKKLFFYHWGKYPNSFVILQGFNLMLTKAIFIYWQPYVAFVNILQRRDVWKYVFDLFLNIKASSELFIDCKCWYDQNCSVDDQNCLWMRIKHDDGLEIFHKMMASWIPLIF